MPPPQSPPMIGSTMHPAAPTDPPITPPLVRDLVNTVLRGMFESSARGIRGISGAGRLATTSDKTSSIAMVCLIRSALMTRFGVDTK
jgi:hypothetical protein